MKSSYELAMERLKECVMEAVNDLPQCYQDALLLNTVNGLGYIEVSHVAGCAIGTVRSRISRARDALATAVAGAMEPV